MGKGDKRSRKGKVWRGSYGNTRRKKKKTTPAFIPKPKVKKAPKEVEAAMPESPVLEAVEPKAAKATAKKPAVKKVKPAGEEKSPIKKEPKKKAAPKEKSEE